MIRKNKKYNKKINVFSRITEGRGNGTEKHRNGTEKHGNDLGKVLNSAALSK